MTDWRSGRVEVSDGYLAYRRTGMKGPPLVLAHGLTDNGLCWARLTAALSDQFDIVMLDARGHGDSSRITADVMHDPGDDLAQAVTALDLQAVTIIGHSVGARAAARCAGEIPDLVSRLILEDPPLVPPADPAERRKRVDMLRERTATFRELSDEQIMAIGKAQTPDWHDEDFPAWAAAKRQFDPEAYPAWSQPWQEALSRVSAPSLLIHGEPARGSLVPDEAVQAIGSLNPHIRCIRIIGAGHNIRRERFSEYLSAVRTFLEAA